MNIQEMMKQAQQLQKKLMQQQEEMAQKTFEASSGGGMVAVTVNGKNEIMSIRIEKDVVNPEEVGMLQDLIVAAVNEANGRAKEEMEKIMGGLMGSMGGKLPGMF